MVEFGIILSPPSSEPLDDRHAYYRSLLEHGQGHFRSAWLPDHLMKGDRPYLEAWTTLTYLASAFPAYTFGHTVLCQSYRNPALLAKMASTFDYLSGGRLVLGIGAGWQADEKADIWQWDGPIEGVTHVTLYFWDRRSLDLFAREVIPTFA